MESTQVRALVGTATARHPQRSFETVETRAAPLARILNIHRSDIHAADSAPAMAICQTSGGHYMPAHNPRPRQPCPFYPSPGHYCSLLIRDERCACACACACASSLHRRAPGLCSIRGFPKEETPLPVADLGTVEGRAVTPRAAVTVASRKVCASIGTWHGGERSWRGKNRPPAPRAASRPDVETVRSTVRRPDGRYRIPPMDAAAVRASAAEHGAGISAQHRDRPCSPDATPPAPRGLVFSVICRACRALEAWPVGYPIENLIDMEPDIPTLYRGAPPNVSGDENIPRVPASGPRAARRSPSRAPRNVDSYASLHFKCSKCRERIFWRLEPPCPSLDLRRVSYPIVRGRYAAMERNRGRRTRRPPSERIQL
jgi:hypothetical protein